LGSVDERTRLDIAQQSYNAGDFRAALEQSNAIYRENPRRLENLLLLGAVYFQVFSEKFRLTLFSVCSVRCILVLMTFLLYKKNI